MIRFFSAFLLTALDTAWWLVIGFAVAGIVREFVPSTLLKRWLGGRGIAPILRGTFIGLALPICSCGVVPIAIGLAKNGAGLGPVVAFLIASPALSPATMIALSGRLGLVFTVGYTCAVCVSAILAGILLDRLNLLRSPQPERTSTCLPGHACEQANDTRISSRLRRSLSWGFFHYGAEMSLDLMFGLILATMVATLVPREWVSNHVGNPTLLSYLIVGTVATPIYVCTLPSVPVLANLLSLGMVPGAALTYLLAGSATNLGELRALARNLSPRLALFFAMWVGGSGILAGWVFDQAIPDLRAIHSPLRADWMTELLHPEGYSLHQLSARDLWLNLPAVLIMLSCLGMGTAKNLRSLLHNPCSVCQFWARSAGIGTAFRACSKPCWAASFAAHLRKSPPPIPSGRAAASPMQPRTLHDDDQTAVNQEDPKWPSETRDICRVPNA